MNWNLNNEVVKRIENHRQLISVTHQQRKSVVGIHDTSLLDILITDFIMLVLLFVLNQQIMNFNLDILWVL